MRSLGVIIIIVTWCAWITTHELWTPARSGPLRASVVRASEFEDVIPVGDGGITAGPDANSRGDLNLSMARRWTGAGSCAAQACHGGEDVVNGAPTGSIGNEHLTWVRRDPHRKAYRILLTDDARAMHQRYRRVSPKTQTPTAPEKDALCLNCHSAQGIADPGAYRSETWAWEDGVSCESCHGAAGNWLAIHSSPSWLTWDDNAKARYGMRPLKSLADRAQTCATCHVGVPGTEVNHELIAAGHPRLRFEFSAYHAVYPKHWNAAREKQSRPDLEADAWRIGQSVTARAALTLLQHHAQTQTKGVWPELADFDCRSCHRSLTLTDNPDKNPPGQPGASRINPWYYAAFDFPNTNTNTAPDPAAWDELQRLMQRRIPRKDAVGNLTQRLIRSLDEQRTAADSSALAGRAFQHALTVRRLLEHAPSTTHPDVRFQHDLRIAALHNAWSDLTQTSLPAEVVAAWKTWRSRDPKDPSGTLMRPADQRNTPDVMKAHATLIRFWMQMSGTPDARSVAPSTPTVSPPPANQPPAITHILEGQ